MLQLDLDDHFDVFAFFKEISGLANTGFMHCQLFFIVFNHLQLLSLVLLLESVTIHTSYEEGFDVIGFLEYWVVSAAVHIVHSLLALVYYAE